MTTTLGVLRTTPGTTYDPQGISDPLNGTQRYALIPDRILRNDGFHDALLVEGFRYHLTKDSVGWLLTAEGSRPHLYLCRQVTPDSVPVPTDMLELAHRALVLTEGRTYSLEQDDTGAWRVLEHANVPGVTS